MQFTIVSLLMATAATAVAALDTCVVVDTTAPIPGTNCPSTAVGLENTADCGVVTGRWLHGGFDHVGDYEFSNPSETAVRILWEETDPYQISHVGKYTDLAAGASCGGTPTTDYRISLFNYQIL